MISSAKVLVAATLANGSRKALVRSHHHSRLLARLTETMMPQSSNAAQLASVPTFQRKQNFFGTISESSNNNSNGESNDAPSVSSGQASITLEGGWTEGGKDPKQEEEQDESEDNKFSEYTTPIVIEMPQVDANESGDKFFVEKWHKQPGDFLEKEDVLCEIATPDFVFGMQIDDEETGIMGEIHAEEGVKVPCHAPICTIYHKCDEE